MRSIPHTLLLPWLLPALALAACGDDDPALAEGIYAELGAPLPSATPAELATFERGRAVALRRFLPADGLGPDFNVSFCAACHEKPVFGGSGGRYRNFLLVGQTLSDGSFVPTGKNGIQTQFTVGGYVPTDEATNIAAQRNPIPFFGIGLLAEISEEEILRHADPDDADGDGISGRANFDRGFVGRFGRKAQSAAIESFIRGPLFNHLGITTNPLPPERRGDLPVSGIAELVRDDRRAPPGMGVLVLPQVGAPDEPTEDADGVPDPELGENDVFDLVAFAMLMAAPEPDEPTEESAAGRALFEEIGCADCHLPALEGPRGLIPAYTDLLIHDMGPELADGIPMGEASDSEFRSAPLWGIAAAAPYLHDGRADTLDEAIRYHGGEGEASRQAYEALSDAERAQIIAFLEALGGRKERSDGLLPPQAPVLEVGDYGGPASELGGADLQRFVRGRAIFDLDMGISAGLGPFFNGDACRACHFDPVIGGAGPIGVNVMRHGVVDPGTGEFTAPVIGTMAHRHATAVDQRPPVDASANVFEPRQTPPVFGLGLVDLVPDETIIALEDPDDLDGDGISGRAHILEDGRLGRLGWKANVPSLAEFARDAMSNEMGITLPELSGLSFGFSADDDGADDPELSREDFEDMVFYMANLAPPPRTRLFPELEDEGELIFDDIACSSCHVPVLHTSDGEQVPLYSDLLLHDVSADQRFGIEAGDAGMREFRTSLLWGLAMTAPYLHDGAAATIEEAILAHGGEAQAARDGYLALTPSLKNALLSFLESL